MADIIPDEVPEFSCHNWDRALNVGFIAYVACDKERPRRRDAIVGPVIINGKQYTCSSVEVTERGPFIRKGEVIGLLIEG